MYEFPSQTWEVEKYPINDKLVATAITPNKPNNIPFVSVVKKIL